MTNIMQSEEPNLQADGSVVAYPAECQKSAGGRGTISGLEKLFSAQATYH